MCNIKMAADVYRIGTVGAGAIGVTHKEAI